MHWRALSVADVFGLCVAAELPLSLAGFPEVEIRERVLRISSRFGSAIAGRWPAAPAHCRDSDYTLVPLDGGAVCLAWDDGLEITVTDGGSRVEIHNSTPHDLRSLSSYIVNFAVSEALRQQGEDTLHGTMVELEGCGLGLIGASGAGKSTLAACLVGRGARLVTDDIVRLVFRDEGVSVHQGPDRLKLFPDAWKTYLPDAPSSGLFHPAGEKELIMVPRAGNGFSASPLHVLIYLDGQPDWPGAPQVEEVTDFEKFRLLAPSTMSSRVEGEERSRQHFTFVTEVARRLPVYRLSYRSSPDHVPQMARLVMEVVSRSRP